MRTLLLTLSSLFVPAVVMACPVCYQQIDLPIARATTLGVGVMLAVVAVVLAAFAAFFIRLRRLAKTAGVSEC